MASRLTSPFVIVQSHWGRTLPNKSRFSRHASVRIRPQGLSFYRVGHRLFGEWSLSPESRLDDVTRSACWYNAKHQGLVNCHLAHVESVHISDGRTVIGLSTIIAR